MEHRLCDVVRVWEDLLYVYDPANPTKVELNILDELRHPVESDSLHAVMVRNQEIKILCSAQDAECPKEASIIDSNLDGYCEECYWDIVPSRSDEPFFKKLNSPRTGTCAYGLMDK